MTGHRWIIVFLAIAAAGGRAAAKSERATRPAPSPSSPPTAPPPGLAPPSQAPASPSYAPPPPGYPPPGYPPPGYYPYYPYPPPGYAPPPPGYAPPPPGYAPPPPGYAPPGYAYPPPMPGPPWTPPPPPPPPPPRTLTAAIGFNSAAAEFEQSVGRSLSLFAGPTFSLGEARLNGLATELYAAGGKVGVRVFLSQRAPKGSWLGIDGALFYAWARFDNGDRVRGTGGGGAVLFGYTWIWANGFVLSIGGGMQYVDLNLDFPTSVSACTASCRRFAARSGTRFNRVVARPYERARVVVARSFARRPRAGARQPGDLGSVPGRAAGREPQTSSTRWWSWAQPPAATRSCLRRRRSRPLDRGVGP
jgi:hypothetical protein